MTLGQHILFKRIVAKMPQAWQAELKRLHFARQIKKGKFVTNEPEYDLLEGFIDEGDWVIDVGANVGHYTKRLSELVGSRGRVLAFEPMPETLALLSANTLKFAYRNVTIFNVAVSDKVKLAGMSLPYFDTGLLNFYEAHLTEPDKAQLSVVTLCLDDISIPYPITLIKIDAEGHEQHVLAGMIDTIKRNRPVLIVETGLSGEVEALLDVLAYETERLPGSPNILCRPRSIDLN